MAMVNHPVINPALFNPNMKDSRWLTLEVCREYTRNKCTRTENECKFAHPPPHVEVQNGRVTCCFDSIKGKCQRKDPPCKYLHPPQHLKEQLLQNGRNNLILKNLQMQAIAAGLQPMVPGVFPTVQMDQYPPSLSVFTRATEQSEGDLGWPPLSQGVGMTMAQWPGALGQAYKMYEPNSQKPIPYPTTVLPGQYSQLVQTHPFLVQNTTGVPHFNPYLSPQMTGVPSMVTAVDANTGATVPVSAQGGVQMPNHTQKMHRADRLEPQMVEVLTTGAGKKRHRDPADDLVLGGGMNSVPGMVPMVKRPAVADSTSGIPVYQPGGGAGAAAYQQAALAAMQLQQQYLPAQSYSIPVAGHPPGVPRF
jgi:hypothetical protein